MSRRRPVDAAGPGDVVGMVTWRPEDEATDLRRLGVATDHEQHWGRGLATEALGLWTDYLFTTTHALRLDPAPYSGKPAMITAGRRLGFVEEARLRRARRWSGGVHDAVVMGVLREERQAPRTPLKDLFPRG